MKRIKSTACFGLISVLIFSSCSGFIPLEYKGYNDLTVTTISDTPTVHINLNLYNPNPIGAKLKNIDMTVSIEENEIGTACLDKPVKIKSKQSFVVPVTMQTSLARLQNLTQPGLESLLFDKPLAVEISGNITIRKFIFKRSYDFIYKDELNITDIKMD